MKQQNIAILALLILTTFASTAQSLEPQVVYSFVATNGSTPHDRLVQGTDGYLYGTTTAGGAGGGFGTVFKVATNGTAMTTLSAFNSTNGSTPEAGLTLGNDGNFYGTTTFGGVSNFGTIFQVTTNGVLTTLVSFTGSNGAYPRGTLAKGNDGSFYGTTFGYTGCSCGGFSSTEYNNGTVFNITTNGVLTMLAVFGQTNGANPYAGLTMGNDGNFYGTTVYGGAGYGTVFQVTTNGVLTSLVSFQNANGANPFAGLTLGPNGLFYGSTFYGGTNGNYGTLYNVTTNGVLNSLVSFGNTNGAGPYDSPTLGLDGNYYGNTDEGGNGNGGTIFRITPGGVFTNLVNTGGARGSPLAGLTLGADGSFYGTTQGAGSSDVGSICKLTTSGILTTLVSFTNFNGSFNQNVVSEDGLSLGLDGSLYGSANYGGASGNGTLFKIATNNVFTLLATFSGTGTGGNGNSPNGQLVQGPAGSFYGTARYGGRIGNGSVFKITTNGVMSTLLSFTNAAGSLPNAVVFGSDNYLYGTTRDGGSNSVGTVFKMTTNGTLTSLVSFNNTNGANPLGALTLGPDDCFYGTTQYNGTNPAPASGGGYGTLFKVTTNGMLTTLVYFNNTNGSTPTGALTLGSDGNIYGTTYYGGAVNLDGGYGYGTVFRVTTNGLLTTLVSFSGLNGAWPQTGVIQAGNGNFYGTTQYGGSENSGTIFELTPNGALSTIASFNAPTAYPNSGLTLGADGNFYGMTSTGGAGGLGVVYRIGNIPSIISQPVSRACLTNTTAAFSVSAMGGLPLSEQWLKGGTFLTDAGRISGSATTNLMLAGVSALDATNYSVVITNSYGAVTSSIANLTVLGLGASLLSGLQVGSGGAGVNAVAFQGITNTQYVIQYANELPGPWFNLSTNFTDSYGNWTIIDSSATNAQRFYRAVH